jgi:long-chain acyl-CoA synthetase
MLGYHQRPDADAEAFELIHGERYLRTGDIGRLDSEGYLWITDRKNDVFKTSGGKQIAPALLERVLVAASRLISRAVVCGANRPYVTALLTLDEEALGVWASANGRSGTPAELSRDPVLRELLERAVEAANAGLARFETIKQFAILERDFSLESAELTPTTKLRRDAISKKYAATVDALYASAPPLGSAARLSPDALR